ncbi:MAG: DUF928 domain-containing protein [Candidatus Thorarchaeota archaeon]
MSPMITAISIGIACLMVVPVSIGVSNNPEENALKSSTEVLSEKSSSDVLPSEPKKSLTPKPESKKKKAATAINMPVYKPPLRGAPVGRIAGGTRGILDEYPSLLCVLTPDDIGLTVQEQPSLYWFLSELPNYPIELTIIEEGAIYPMLETPITAAERPGVQSVQLTDYNVRLQQGIQYKWFIAIVPDPDRRSKDILAWGAIERVESPEQLRTKLAQSDRAGIPHVYAEAGLWYDALTAISDLIDAYPNDMILRKQRASLLDQVGLTEIAKYEREHYVPARK